MTDEERLPFEEVDVSNIPDLIRLANQVRQVGGPLSLQAGGKEIGILQPPRAVVAPRRADVLRILAEHSREYEPYAVRSIAIFGSVARDEARPDSDVDILVEFDRPIGLFTFVGLKDLLGQLLERTVDLVTTDGLRAEIRDDILREAIRAA